MGQFLTVSVKADGSVYVDRDQVTLDAVGTHVNDVRAGRPLIVKGDQAVTFKQVRDVVDAIHKVVDGTDTILLAADKPKEE